MNIFISYAHEDNEYAARLFDSLSKHPHLNLWFDKENLLPGSNWKNEILTGIEKSDFILILLSTQSVSKTGFVQREIREAIERISLLPPEKRLIIPVRVEECTPSHRELRSYQYLDLFPDWNAGIQKLYKALGIKKYTHKYVAHGANKYGQATLELIESELDVLPENVKYVCISDIPKIIVDLIPTKGMLESDFSHRIFIKLWTIASSNYPRPLYRKSDWLDLANILFRDSRNLKQKEDLTEILIRQWALAKEMPGYDEDDWRALRKLIQEPTYTS